ncbi:ferrochelatase [Myxococcota bacterium]|nr:ferrochelatase [Myxococcota bacterium]MBU1896362.1 ferrochelatase [Myxococcota bacterium]
MNDTIALVGLVLGSPSGPEEVEPFLTELFLDAEIIKLPFQRFLGPLIAKRRAPKATARYQIIGGASPLMRISRAQLEATAEVLAQRGARVKPYLVARYLGPRAKDVLAEIRAEGIKRIVALPLYPHRSITTTGSAFTDLEAARAPGDPEILRPGVWCAHPRYIKALAETVREALADFDATPHLLLAAHSIPLKVARDDPYQGEILETGRALREALGWSGPYSHAYQSRVGPIRWLEPDTGVEIRRLAAEGVREVLVVPLSFVSDHLETLFDLDYDLANEAKAAGVTRYVRAAALNTRPMFIEALADLVEGCLEEAEA